MGINTRAYMEQYLQIRTKDMRIVPFAMNAPQKKLYDALGDQWRAGKPMRAIILKARQLGFSTLTEAMIFKRTATRRNVKSGIVAHKADATANLYAMSRLFYERLPEGMKPARKSSNAQELVFDNSEGTGLKSSIRCMTAGGEGIGRSDTFQNLHISEYAFWPGQKKQTLVGLLQAVPDLPDTMVVIESTANGYEDFKALWDAARAGANGYAAVFVGWSEMEEYRRTPEPGFAPTEEERALAEAYGLDDAQIAWRRWCIENNCGGDLNIFHQEYPICPEEAFLASGTCIFDTGVVTRRLAELEKLPEPARGEMAYLARRGAYADTLENAEFVPGKAGPLKVYKPPEAGVPYVIGADTAGEGSDWCAAHVLDNRDGSEAAVFHAQRMDEDTFTMQVMALGLWYNEALLAPEANFSTYPIRTMERFGYPALYTREVPDTYTGRMEKRHGFLTSSKTRPLILSQLVRVVREDARHICDAETLRECLTFCRNDKGRAEALEGEHDDLVLSLAIAHEARTQQDTRETAPPDKNGPVRDDWAPADRYDDEMQGFLEF